MVKISDFWKSGKYPIIWTIGYVFMMWIILKGMFNFNLFSHAHWVRLMHAQLHGFAGFVFGILILAALPLYIATTMVVIRTGGPLFTIPRPAIISKILGIMTATPDTPPAAPDAAPTPDTPAQDSASAKNQDDIIPVHAAVPAELRAAFIRARDKIPYRAPVQTKYPTEHDTAPRPADATAPVVATIESAPTAIPDAAPDAFPLPPDFDINLNSDDAPAAPIFGDVPLFSDAPTFTEINFDAPAAPAAAIPQDIPAELAPVAEYLNSISQPFSIDGDVILTDTSAIASHTDPDFWVADDETWFAAGKSRPSPAAAATAAAATHGLQPVLYIGAQNIMDLDTKITQWESGGIYVIDDLGALPD